MKDCKTEEVASLRAENERLQAEIEALRTEGARWPKASSRIECEAYVRPDEQPIINIAMGDTTLELANDHANICSNLAGQHKSDPAVFEALTDAAAIIRDLLRELRRETERRWEGNRRAAQEYIEDMRDVLQEAAQICKDLDGEALAKQGRLACGAECAAAIADLAARMNVPIK